MPAAIRAAVEPAAVSEGAVVVHCQGVVAVDAADLGSFFVRLQHARSIARYIDRVLGPDQPEAPEPHRRPRGEHDDPDDEDVADDLLAAVVVVVVHGQRLRSRRENARPECPPGGRSAESGLAVDADVAGEHQHLAIDLAGHALEPLLLEGRRDAALAVLLDHPPLAGVLPERIQKMGVGGNTARPSTRRGGVRPDDFGELGCVHTPRLHPPRNLYKYLAVPPRPTMRPGADSTVGAHSLSYQNLLTLGGKVGTFGVLAATST